MNRKEAAKWLIDNPRGEFEYKRYKGTTVKFNDKGEMLTSQGYPFRINFNDDAEFEVVRNLRKMNFGEAMWHYYNVGVDYDCDIKSVCGKYDYGNADDIISLEAYKGLWTIEGVYEE